MNIEHFIVYSNMTLLVLSFKIIYHEIIIDYVIEYYTFMRYILYCFKLLPAGY